MEIFNEKLPESIWHRWRVESRVPSSHFSLVTHTWRDYQPLLWHLAALGCANITPKHGRVIKRIAQHGFFKVGGVLAGTHAFLAYKNMLGVLWSVADTTRDMDFAHPGNNLSIAIPNQLKMILIS